jgi:rare lipoprotein A
MKILIALLILTSALLGEERGIASHYSVKTNGGTHTASGQKLRDNSFTAAHKTLPFGTIVKVTNLNNYKSIKVTINNRGPYVRGRIIDLSQAAAHSLGFHKNGLTKVKVEVISLGNNKYKLEK